jgi:hypothetical protein
VNAAIRTLLGGSALSATTHVSTPSAIGASSATRRSDSLRSPVWKIDAFVLNSSSRWSSSALYFRTADCCA